MRVLVSILAVLLLAAVPARAAAPEYKWEDTVQQKRVEQLIGAFSKAADASPKDYDLRVRTSQLAFYAWRLEKESNKRRLGYARICVKYAKEAIQIRPDGAEGWHWLGAGLGLAGLTRGVLNSLQLIPEIKRAFEKSAELNPAYLDGSALGQLGRVHTVLPGFPVSIGDHVKAMEYVLQARKRAPNQTLYNLYIADLLWAAGRNEEAIAELRKIPAMKPETEIQYFTYETSKRKAVELIRTIESGEKRDPFYDVLSDIQPGLVE